MRNDTIQFEMRLAFIFISINYMVFCCNAQNTRKGNIEYDLGSGGSVILSQRTYDSLRTIKFSSDSTSVTASMATDKIFKLYQDKCKNLFLNMRGLAAPDFEAKDTEGYKQRASLYRGRVLILHFWSFWSGSFDNEIPELNRLMAEFGKDGLAVLSFTGISLGDDEKRKLKENPLKSPLIENAYLFVDDFFKTKLMRPCIVIIDKNGLMSSFYEGSMLPKSSQNPNAPADFDLEAQIKELIK